MNNNILDKNVENQQCTGCSICSAVCPTKAITIELTNHGFYEPKVDEKLCVECGLCKKCCYKFDSQISEDKKDDYKSYSAINKDGNELKTCTSGGVSIELMKECISQGYKIVGVAYDYVKDIAVTKIATCNEELEQFKGSKYFQSYTVDALNEIVENKNEKYAIFGTPCQIYSISKYCDIKRNRDNFILVDLFCHGCPSMNVWKKYISQCKEKYNTSNFDKIEFRSKVHGWHEYGFKFFKSNSEYSNQKINDPFYELFFDMNTHNEACYNCKMRSSLKYTDLRMGDFWGPQYDTDTKGVSAVITCTEKGEKLFKQVNNKFTVQEHSFLETVKDQSYGKEHRFNSKIRNNTLEILGSDARLEEIIKAYRSKYSLKKKTKIKVKNTFKLLPKSVYFRVKKILHSI